MSKENIFDLSKIAGSSNDVESKHMSASDQEASLIGFDLVPPQEWKLIQPGSQIRYLRNSGEFRKGGTVQDVWTHIDKSGNEIVKIDVTASMGNSYRNAKWSITSQLIDKIWIKKSEQLRPIADNSGIKDDLDLCKESIKQLTKEIQKINSEQFRMIDLIKKLHNLS